MKKGLIILVALAVVLGVWGVSSYNRLTDLEQAVQTQWAQVENVYQRRADLIPNLVETVKGAAAFEKETYTQVAEARARAGQATVGAGVIDDPQAFERFQQAQQQLSSALSRLIAVSERYPDLEATGAFRDLMSQLEGTENRISVERMRFNEAAQAYNAQRRRFPTVLIAGMLGFPERPYFRAQEGADRAPQVRF